MEVIPASVKAEAEEAILRVSRLAQHQGVPGRSPHVQRMIDRRRAQAAAQAARQAQPANGNGGGGNNANNAGGNGGGGGNNGAGGGNNAGNGNQPGGGFFSRMSPANRATLKLALLLMLCAVVGILMLLVGAWIHKSVGAAAAETYKQFDEIGASRKKKDTEDHNPAQVSGTARMHAECGRYTVAQEYTIEGSCFYFENTTTTPVKVPVTSVARPRSLKANFEGKGDVLVTVGDNSCSSTLTYHCRDWLVTHVSQADSKYNMALQVPPGQGAILTVR